MANSAVVGILRVLLTANTAEFDTAMKRGAESAKVFSRDMTKLGAQATQLGSVLTKTLTLLILGLGGASAKAAIDFESSFAGVRKTVKATEQQFAQLADGMRALSKQIPINVNELNKIGEAAGQLGIKTQNILGFTEVMAKLGVTTNLASDQAATALARLANITQMPQGDFDRLGSTIVALGNNFATTESEIVDFGLRIAGAGKIAGLSEHQILAIGAAMSSVGVEAEAGGTAVQKVLNGMTEAVATGNKQLAGFARTAGMSAKEFQTAFRDDAAGAFSAFVSGLREQGDQAFVTLDKLGLGNERVIRAFLSLANAGDLLNDTLKTGEAAWRENSALTKEAGERFKTTQSQLTLLWNRMKDVGITIGNALLPLITSTVGMLDRLIPLVDTLAKTFAGLPMPVQATAVGVLALVAAAGPALLLFGQMAFAAGALAKVFTSGGLLANLGLATVATRGLTGALIGLRTVVAPLVALWAGWEIGQKASEMELFGLKLKSWLPVLWNWKLGLGGISLENLILAETSREALKAQQALQNLKILPMASHGQTTPATTTRGTSQPAVSEEMQQYAEAVQKLVEQIGGAEAINAAKLWMDALPRIGGLTKLATDDQKALNKILVEALDAYRRMGKDAPLALRAIALETSALVAQNRALTSGLGRGPIGLPSKTFDEGIASRDLSAALMGPAHLLGTGLPVHVGPTPLPRQTFDASRQSLFAGLNTQLPQAMLSAITGGGNVAQAVAGTAGMNLGQNLVTKFGSTITQTLGATFGGAINAILPGVGALAGPLISLVGKLFGKSEESAKVSPLRDAFFELHGGLEKLNPQVLALTGNLKLVEAVFQAKTVEDYNRAIEHLEGVLSGAKQAAFDASGALVTIGDKLSTITTLSPELQGALERALNARTPQEYLDKLREINRVIDEQAAKQARILGTMEKYGLAWTEAGKNVKQAKLNEVAQGLVTDFDTLREAGVDINHQMKAMGPHVRGFIENAQAAGVEVPESMRRIIQTAIDAGEIFDKDGKKITDIKDLGLTFGSTMETVLTKTIPEAMTTLTRVLEELVKLLGIKLPKAAEEGAEKTQDAFDGIKAPVLRPKIEWPEGGPPTGGYDFDMGPQPDTEGYAHGSAGIRDFGSGTPAVLHGRERVQTEDQMLAERMALLGSRQPSVTINVAIDGVFSEGDLVQTMQRRFVPIFTQIIEDNVNGARTNLQDVLGVP